MPVAVIENPDAVAPGLVSDIETQAQEVAYLAGVLAGQDDRDRHRRRRRLRRAADLELHDRRLRRGAEGDQRQTPSMLYSVIGEAAYDDAAGAKRVTEQQIAAGADVIFGMGDGASFGMIQAIEEHNAEDGANKVWFIDVIGDKNAEHGDVAAELGPVRLHRHLQADDRRPRRRHVRQGLHHGRQERRRPPARPARRSAAGDQGRGRRSRSGDRRRLDRPSPPSATPRR